jgi:DNA-binding transcriptional MerR regulator
MTMTVGALARRTGLTVRTLHHYETIGLLEASQRTEAGHRRYTDADLARLQQVVSLRAIGLPLGEIRRVLDEGVDPRGAVDRLLAHLHEQVEQAGRLIGRLDAIAAQYRAAEAVSAEDLIHTIRLTIMFEKHYTPEQLEQIKQRGAEVGEARIAEVQQEWSTLFGEFDRHREAGTDPASPAVQELVKRAEGLIGEFTGGDGGIRRSLNAAVQEDPQAMYRRWGISPELGAYYGRAMEARGKEK